MKEEKTSETLLDGLDQLIHEIQGQKVMLDADLAKVYGVTTANLNRAVKRNQARFPGDFVFQLSQQEHANLMCQMGTSRTRHGGTRKRPWAFTEHGAIMAANTLNSHQAVQMSVFVVRAFIKMRTALSDNRELARKLAALETELKDRLDVHEAAIVTILQRVMDIIDPPALPASPGKKIGYHVKEPRADYHMPVPTTTPAARFAVGGTGWSTTRSVPG